MLLSFVLITSTIINDNNASDNIYGYQSYTIFLKRFIAQGVYTVCTRINYKIVPLISLNKYLHYGTSGTEEYVYEYRCK